MKQEYMEPGSCWYALQTIVLNTFGSKIWDEACDLLNKEASLESLHYLRAQMVDQEYYDYGKSKGRFRLDFPKTYEYVQGRKSSKAGLGYSTDGILYYGNTARYQGRDFEWGSSCADIQSNAHLYWDELDHSISNLICEIKWRDLNYSPLRVGNWRELGLPLFLAEASGNLSGVNLKFNEASIAISNIWYKQNNKQFVQALGIQKYFV